jgi:hypothetical protein
LFHPPQERVLPQGSRQQALAEAIQRLVQAQKLALEEDLAEEQAKVLAEAQAEGYLEEQALELVQQQEAE